MTTAWAAVRAAIDAEDVEGVAALVAGLGRDERREVARALPLHLPQVRPGRIEAMRVAGCGAIGGAAAVVSWLCRGDLRAWSRKEAPLILRAVSARPQEWRADLAVRLSRRLREPDPNAGLALELLRVTGAEPPAHGPLTRTWLASVLDVPWQTPPERIAAALRDDPLLDVMLPRLFEADGVGSVMAGHPGAPETLRALTLDGRVSREALLGGCVGRLLRGGSAAELRSFAGLHELLAPAPDEVAARRGDYLALLPSGPALVADLALRHLRRVGPLPPDDAREAIVALLFRTEGRLITAGLAWLDRLAARDGAELDGFAAALGVALGARAGRARLRAVHLVVEYAARFTPAGAEPLVEAAALMPAGEGEPVVAALSGAPVPSPRFPGRASPGGGEDRIRAEPFVPLPLRPPPVPERLSPRVRAPGWLGRARLSELDWRGAERWLDVFVRLATTDRAGLKAALTMPGPCPQRPRDDVPPTLADRATALGTLLIRPGVREPSALSPGSGMMAARFAEVHRALAGDALPPYLLATPTHADGRLEAAELVFRLEGYERDGAEALPLDLRQALLRLPRDTPGDVVARASHLKSPAGRAAAGWLAGTPGARPPEPRVTLRWEPGGAGARVVTVITGLPFALRPQEPSAGDQAPIGGTGHGGCDVLLAVMPGHREVVAAQLVGDLTAMPSLDDLRALAMAGGPAGDAVALILAHHLCGGPRGGAVAPLLWLAASGDLPGGAVGRQLAALFRHGDGHSPAGAMAALRSAARQGAHLQVWEAVAALLDACLPGPGERATGTHTRLVAFAAEAAAWAGARGASPAVARLAAGTRVTGLVREARRLHAQLTT